MGWAHRLWAGLAIVGIAAVVAVGLGVAADDAGIAVESVDATGSAPDGPPSCGEPAVRTVDVSVSVARDAIGPENPQVWGVGLSIRASALGETKTRTATLGPSSRRNVTVPFTEVVAEPPASQRYVDAVIQVSQGTTVVDERTVTATLPPVTANESC